MGNLLTNQRKAKGIFSFYHAKESLKSAMEAIGSDVLSMKRLKC